MILEQCKKCRRVVQKLFLKGERCFTQKCAVTRRAYAPGAQGGKKKRRRGEVSEYGRQLIEKQKLRITYGVLERPFKKYVLEAMQAKGDNREKLMERLETRLDNVVFRLGFAKSRFGAKQIAGHGHILINGRKLDVPSYQVKVGDVITIKEKSKKSALFNELPITLKKYETPAWLSLDKEKLEGKMNTRPTVSDFGDLASVGMVVEYYSR